MTLIKSQQAKELVANWAITGRILDKLRVEEHRNSNLAETLLSLSDVTRASLIAHPPKPYSGMIEMQRHFAKMRK